MKLIKTPITYIIATIDLRNELHYRLGHSSAHVNKNTNNFHATSIYSFITFIVKYFRLDLLNACKHLCTCYS